MVSSNRLMELLETKTKSGLLRVVESFVRIADTGKITWISIKFEAI